MPTRDDIGLATCKKIIADSSSIHGVRVAHEAQVEARKELKNLIKKIGTETFNIITLTKKKTVNYDTLEYVVDSAHRCDGIKNSDLVSPASGRRLLPVAGIERIFRGTPKRDVRISKKAKQALVSLGEAYLAFIGRRASELAKASGRTTIKKIDIILAIKLIS